MCGQGFLLRKYARAYRLKKQLIDPQAGVTVPGRMSVRKGKTEQPGRLAGDRCLNPDLSINQRALGPIEYQNLYAAYLGQISWRDVIRTRGA